MSKQVSKNQIVTELRVQDIHSAYKKKEVLKGVSLSIKQGEIVAVIGPNGAGKSTLLKVISGFIQPTAGAIYFEKKDITALPQNRRVNIGISYFMQGGKVFQSLTVKENLDLSTAALSSAEKKNEISSLLNLFPNLENMLGRRAGLLSGGERQSLALAMILAKRPQLLLLDEPSAGLSPKLVQDLLRKIREFNNNSGTSILLVEQNIRTALNIADRAIMMVNGSIAFETQQPLEWSVNGQLEHLFLDYDNRSPTEGQLGRDGAAFKSCPESVSNQVKIN